jgi:multimeric flavodoxin WrbA
MKATILLGTLKREGLSHTATLCEFVAGRMERAGIQCETVKLVDYEIPPGTYSNMGPGDQWPLILDKILHSEIVIFATPIWWSNQSSLIQRVIERLDELHDYLMAGKPSGLEGKVAGVIITGDSDGAQHITGQIYNFVNGIGLLIPPFASLSVLDEHHAKSSKTTREQLLRKYEKDQARYAEKMIEQMVAYVRA